MKDSNNQGEIRTSPPSREANNTDVFIWALYLLGGAERSVDVEEIYLKTFEIAPLRFGWRTRPDIPNFKKTAKALQEIEAKSHYGLLQKLGANNRRLTSEGLQWVEDYKPLFEQLYSSKKAVAPAATSALAKKIRDLKSTEAWNQFVSQENMRLASLAKALRLSVSSPDTIWSDRFADLNNLAALANDELIFEFLALAKTTFQERESR